jgi:hypothetical protein
VEAQAPVLRRRNRRLRELRHVAEPLERDQRLDALPGPVRVRDLVHERLRAGDQPLLAQRSNHRVARLIDVQALERLARGRGHACVLADHGDLLEPVGAADLEVVRVVARSDLERAGAELGVDVLVGDDRQPPSDERQDRVLADQPRVALVVGVNRDRGVGEDRLRPDRRDRDRT